MKRADVRARIDKEYNASMPARALCLFVVAAALVAAPRPALSDARAVVSELATLIEDNYFDPDKGRDIARELRRAERAGALDRYVEPRDLAAALTSRLKSADRHFNVVWFAAPDGPPAAASDAHGRASALDGRGHGFRTVSMLAGSVGYIEMRSLPYISFRRPNDAARLAADAALQLISGANAVILDLRYAVGGYPEMAGYIISAFTAPNADIYNVFHGRGERQSERPVQPYHSPRLDVPVYVLVSGSTASAAESVAYTLQAAQRATIVGERTSGAANPGGMLPVGAGFNVFISNSTPINPITGTNWEGQGVQPEITVPAEQSLERAHVLALEHVRDARGGAAATEIRWALEYLTAGAAPRAPAKLDEYAGTYADSMISVADDGLRLRRLRHPVLRLRPLRGDTFMVIDEPSQRVIFERKSGAISGLHLQRASGFSIWQPRS